MSILRIISLVGSLMGARLAGAALGFAVQFALARMLAPEDVGTIMLGMSLAAFLSLLATAGYPALGLTAVARYHALGRRSLVAAYFTAARRDMLLLWAVGGAILAVVLWLRPLTEHLREALAIGALAAVPYGMLRLNNIAANAQRRFVLSFAPDFIARPALLLGAIGLMAVLAAPIASWQVLTAFAAINFAVAAVQAMLLGQESALAGLGTGLRHGLAPILRRRAAPLALVALVSIAYSDLVTMVAGLLLPPAEVAIVGIAVKVAALAGFMAHSLQQFVLRDLTAAMARGSGEETRMLLLRINGAGLALMVLALAGMLLLGHRVLAVFGPAYVTGYWALVLFTLGQLVRAGGGMNTYLLSLRGEQARISAMCLVSVVVLISSAALMAPHWGLLGIAAASLIGDLVWVFALGVLVRRDSPIGGDIFALLRAR